MKYILIPYIALGFILSLAIGIEYYCNGQEVFPEYYASPFVFKEKSLGSSMTYYYSVSGLIINVAIWSIALLLGRLAILYLLKKTGNNKTIKNTYRGIVGVLVVFTSMHVAFDYVTLGSGFQEGLNYWYMDLNTEAKEWGQNCEWKWTLFQK